MKTPKLISGTVMVLGLLLATGPVFAAGAVKYPAYAHALADLRVAKSLLEKGGSAATAGVSKAVGTGGSIGFYPTHCKVVGIDLSAGMLREARRKIGERELNHITVGTG